jgi:hypothetical protein
LNDNFKPLTPIQSLKVHREERPSGIQVPKPNPNRSKNSAKLKLSQGFPENTQPGVELRTKCWHHKQLEVVEAYLKSMPDDQNAEIEQNVATTKGELMILVGNELGVKTQF